MRQSLIGNSWVVVTLLVLSQPRESGAQEILHAIEGEQSHYALGTSVSGAGDVNNDGYEDYVVGIPGYWESFSGGRVEVRSGVDHSLIHSNDGSQLSELGWSVSGGGDVNGDGFMDYVAGDPHHNFDKGRIELFSGYDGSLLRYQFGKQFPDLYLGWSVSLGGDYDNDGFDDYIGGAPGKDPGARPGYARVYSGAAGIVLHEIAGSTNPWDSSASVGTSVAHAGDVDMDGTSDFAIGAPYHSQGQIHTGGVGVYSGGSGAILYQWFGGSGFELGISVAGGGDLDKDGHDDVIVGAPGFDLGPVNMVGMVRAYSGKTGSVLFDRIGVALNDRFGFRVAGVGDLDGDSYPDFAASSVLADVGQFQDAGMLRVYSGQNGGVAYEAFGDTTDGMFGSSLAGPGDLNNNGSVEMLVGEGGDDANGLRSGAMYVFGTSSFSDYGAGCPGSLFQPELLVTGAPTPGGQITLQIKRGLDGESAFVVIGTAEAAVPMGYGCTLNVAPLLPMLIGPLPLGGPLPTLDGSGGITISAALPVSTPTVTFYLQAFALDPGVAGGFSNTNGVSMSVN